MAVRKQSHRRAGERGVTIVEGALFMISFFVLIFGVFELGRFLSVRQVLTNAAREGARFAVAPTSQTNNLPNETEIIARVNSFLTAASVNGATVTTMCPVGAPESCTSKDASMSVAMGLVNTDYTKVTVTKSYTVFGPIFNSLAITLRGEAIMRRETSE